MSGLAKPGDMQGQAEGGRTAPVDVGEGDRLPLQLVEHLVCHVSAVPALLLVPMDECCHLHISVRLGQVLPQAPLAVFQSPQPWCCILTQQRVTPSLLHMYT